MAFPTVITIGVLDGAVSVHKNLLDCGLRVQSISSLKVRGNFFLTLLKVQRNYTVLTTAK